SVASVSRPTMCRMTRPSILHADADQRVVSGPDRAGDPKEKLATSDEDTHGTWLRCDASDTARRVRGKASSAFWPGERSCAISSDTRRLRPSLLSLMTLPGAAEYITSVSSGA